MSSLQRWAGLLGTLLLVATCFVVSRESRSQARRRSSPPVEELAQNLGEAWAGHHTP
jgi:hypothetical protein